MPCTGSMGWRRACVAMATAAEEALEGCGEDKGRLLLLTTPLLEWVCVREMAVEARLPVSWIIHCLDLGVLYCSFRTPHKSVLNCGVLNDCCVVLLLYMYYTICVCSGSERCCQPAGGDGGRTEEETVPETLSPLVSSSHTHTLTPSHTVH